MTLGALKAKIASYLQQPIADFGEDEENLVTLAIENARLEAEKSYSWRRQRVAGSLVVQPGGSDLGDTTVLVEDEPVAIRIKAIDSAWSLNSSGEVVGPLTVITQRAYVLRTQKIRRAGRYNRYPSDADPTPLPASGRNRLIIHGNRAVLAPVPSEATTVTLDCQTWMETYPTQDDDYEDWMLIYGSDYLFWRAIIEVNYLTKNFVPRQEGNIDAPQQLADRALMLLKEADAHFTN